MLSEVSHAMRDPRVGAVQSRVRIHNRDRLLAAVQDLEFGCVADASQSMRNTLRTVGLGGNGQFARLSALTGTGRHALVGCLVEDLELGLRMHLAGSRLRYLPHASVTQQGLVDAGRLLRQRTRWAQGNLQCVRYLPRWSRPGASATAVARCCTTCSRRGCNAAGAVAVAVLWLMAAGRLLVGPARPVPRRDRGPSSAWRPPIWTGALFVPGLLWAVTAPAEAARRDGCPACCWPAWSTPCFLVLGLVSTWRAIGRHLARRQRLGQDRTPRRSRLTHRRVKTVPDPRQKRSTHGDPSPRSTSIAGTRPEAIKLAPVVTAMRAAGRVAPVLSPAASTRRWSRRPSRPSTWSRT